MHAPQRRDDQKGERVRAKFGQSGDQKGHKIGARGALRQSHVERQQGDDDRVDGIGEKDNALHYEAVELGPLCLGRIGRRLGEVAVGIEGKRVFAAQRAAPTSPGNNLPSPSDITSTASAARSRPMRRVITLMPVFPSTLAMRPDRLKATHTDRPMTTP